MNTLLMPSSLLSHCLLSVCPQSQPREETCCFNLVCALIMKEDASTSSPLPLSFPSVYMSAGHWHVSSTESLSVWLQHLSQCQQTVCVSVCPTTSLHLTFNLWCRSASVCNYSNNPAGLTSLLSTRYCIRQNTALVIFGVWKHQHLIQCSMFNVGHFNFDSI